METKRCSKCGEEKPLSEFYRNRNYTDGLLVWCKSCHRDYRIAYYSAKRKHSTSRQPLMFTYTNRKEYYRQYAKTDKRRAYSLNYQRNCTKKLTDSYIKSLLRNFTKDQISPDLIELKRAELKLKRAIKEKTNERS